RLLDGDVGSGKTAVAAVAMVNAARADFQCALMAPTEILARQHFETLKRLYAGQPFTIALVTNGYKRSATGGKEISCANKAEAAILLDAVAKGQVAVVVGTHALIEDAVRFRSLALAVVDEQHRFGVDTRRRLTKKSGVDGVEPHLLSMTATPIPRSLALTVFGDLDLSLLRRKPSNRRPVKTKLVAPKGRAAAYEFIRREIAGGRQVFVVCPLIDQSDLLEVTSVKEEFDRLRKEVFPEANIAMLHGKLSSAEKEQVMKDFLERNSDILVSTSVVEVGVDVPNASVIVIEGAERFGLSQLHQFRGRVGRAEHQSHCFLFPTNFSPQVRDRLKAMTEHADGFALAEIDLKIRGPGDILGEQQSGFVPSMLAAALGDLDLVKNSRQAAADILESDPELEKHQPLRASLTAAVDEAHLE
ncbi:MAG: helicase-related protein, partial [Patescibacteria group bacterium]